MALRRTYPNIRVPPGKYAEFHGSPEQQKLAGAEAEDARQRFLRNHQHSMTITLLPPVGVEEQVQGKSVFTFESGQNKFIGIIFGRGIEKKLGLPENDALGEAKIADQAIKIYKLDDKQVNALKDELENSGKFSTMLFNEIITRGTFYVVTSDATEISRFHVGVFTHDNPRLVSRTRNQPDLMTLVLQSAGNRTTTVVREFSRHSPQLIEERCFPLGFGHHESRAGEFRDELELGQVLRIRIEVKIPK